MSDEIPQSAQSWRPNDALVYLKRVSPKCIVRSTPYEESRWLEIGGASRGGKYVDKAQARVYYQRVEQHDPECRVLLPDDAPFRACRKGKIDSRSKSFDQKGNPVPAVRLLYALKTGRHDDRTRAVESYPVDVWGPNTREEIHAKMKFYVDTDENFRIFAGEQLARSATQEKGLSDWNLWENVADDAAAFTRHLMAIAKGETSPNNHSLFKQAVEETTIEHHGLPAQLHVRKRWEKLGGKGEWVDIRDRLGFNWLLEVKDWKKAWDQSSREIGGGYLA